MRLDNLNAALCTVLATGAMLLASSAEAQAPEKFSLSMFHFNVQYVAGGLEGFPSGHDTEPEFDLDDAQVQDQIIVESFAPILDLFEAHAAWRVTLEMQAYMVEVMAERHPQLLDQLRRMVLGGQVELVSFHYSDQLFLAYPRLDMERSHDLMEAVWAAVGFAPSPVVFCQEGQFGLGAVRFAKERGRSIFVLPKNLFRFQHADIYPRAAPLYTYEGVDVLLGGHGLRASEFEVSWNFFDDGERLATNEGTPYFGYNFKLDPEAMAAYEIELINREAEGFRIATVGEFVTWAKGLGVRPEPLPPVLDGTWQPRSTSSMHKWTGLAGIFHVGWQNERDNEVLTANVRARHNLMWAETLVEHAAARGHADADALGARLLACWRDALLGQVTDATGINPWLGEVRYSLELSAKAEACAREIQVEVGRALDAERLWVDPSSGEVRRLDEPTDEERFEKAEPLIDDDAGFEVIADGREFESRWERSLDRPGVHRLRLLFTEPREGQTHVEVRFPLDQDSFALRPALVDDPVEAYAFTDFDFEEEPITLPVADGLIGLAPGLWLIKETSWTHIGASFEPSARLLTFADWTAAYDKEIEWRFWFVEGSEREARELAAVLNITPTAEIEIPVDTGCNCANLTVADKPSSVLLFSLLALLSVRRRR